MNLNLRLVSCPTCSGKALENNISCLTCSGTGMWLETEQGNHLTFPIPVFENSSHIEDGSYLRWARYGLTGISLSVTALSFIYLTINNPSSFAGLFWTKGFANALFGISGLSSFLLLPFIQRAQTSDVSLHELTQDIAEIKDGSALDLARYSNTRVKELFKQAASVAQDMRSAVVTDNILLLTLLQQPRILGLIGRTEISPADIFEYLRSQLPPTSETPVHAVSFSAEARTKIYEGALEALEHDFPYVDLEDILLAYAKDKGEFYPALFKYFKLDYKQLYSVSRWYAADQERTHQWAFWLERGRARPKGFMNKAWTALPTPFLDSYSQDITRLASNGQVSSVSVRNFEINQILQTLGRTQKNNVILVGEPGVGKNAIVGAIALKMIEEDVPEILKDKRLVSMDMSALLGSSGGAENSIQKVIEEVAQAGNVILVIPDIHVLIGTSSGALDAASLLANALNRGYLQVLTTATYQDYHRYVETNPTFSSLLELVEIKEVEVEDAIAILEEEAPGIEGKQGVLLTYPALEAAAVLAKRYFPDRVLPDSAISLLDETASSVQISKGTWVRKEDVEAVVEKKTNIPIRSADVDESALLLHLEEELHKRVIGQVEAVTAIANALRRARAGLQDTKRPLSSFLFVGPTGVGKTETAKALADLYFKNEQSMIRLDMSEYQDSTAIYKLIGSPEGGDSGGTLTNAIREHPFSLILLDEIEKAYPDVLNLFLQVLDDGRLTENNGRTVYFNNAIIIATSNAGSSEIVEMLGQGAAVAAIPQQIMKILQKQFRPEFINRFDGVIPFHPLSRSEIDEVVTLMLTQVISKMTSQGYVITFAPEAVSRIGELGFDPLYGARPLRRVIQDKVEGLLANQIISGTLKAGETLRITAEMIQ